MRARSLGRPCARALQVLRTHHARWRRAICNLGLELIGLVDQRGHLQLEGDLGGEVLRGDVDLHHLRREFVQAGLDAPTVHDFQTKRVVVVLAPADAGSEGEAHRPEDLEAGRVPKETHVEAAQCR